MKEDLKLLSQTMASLIFRAQHQNPQPDLTLINGLKEVKTTLDELAQYRLRPDKTLLNPDFKADIDAYIKDGRRIGGFMYAVLTNNLDEAISRADSEALANLPHIIAYLKNDCRQDCWGSVETVSKWFLYIAEQRH